MNVRTVSNVHLMLNVKILMALTNVLVILVIMAMEKSAKVRLFSLLQRRALFQHNMAQ
jgi:hypothetical protein